MNDPAIALLNRFMLALCVWREARGESPMGQLLVAQTIKNRVLDKRWPDTYVGVITQPFQFSAFNKNDPNATLFPHEGSESWAVCVTVADAVLASPAQFTDANHYHTKAVSPPWKDESKIVHREGAHIFYKL